MQPSPNSTSRRYSLAAITLLVLWALISPLNSQATEILQGSGASYVAFEAEGNAALIIGTPTTWTEVSEAGASGGKALMIGGTGANDTSPHSFAQYQIRFAAVGDYHLFYRWRADEARTAGDVFTANSCWFSLPFAALSTPGDQSAFVRTEAANATTAPANNVYAWSREADSITWSVAEADVGKVVVFTLGTREPGMIIDRLIFSTDPTLAPAQLDALINSETDVVTQGLSETYVAFEAEAQKANLINGTPTFWARKAEGGASGGSALAIDGTGANDTSPHSFAQYQIRFAAAGDYYLFYLWRADEARTAGDVFTANSCWFSLPFAALSTAGDQTTVVRTEAANATTAPANNVYAWSREAESIIWSVTEADVGKVVVFTMGTREPGMIIDRLIFSTDPTLTPVQLDALPNTGTQPPAPEVRTASGSAALNQVTLTFTRPLDPGSVAPAKFTPTGGLTINTATVDANDARIVHLTTSAQTEGTVYTIAVNDVRDTSGTAIKANTTTTFTAWRRANGWITKEIYFGVPGTTVDELKNAPNFQAGLPDRIEYVRGFSLDREPLADNYGAKMSAFFQPSASADYELFVANDDEAELSLSSDTTQANLTSLGIFPLSLRAFTDVPSATATGLTADQPRLLVGLLKQSTADVYLRVGARRAGDSTIPPVLSGDAISTWVNPDLGTVSFTQQPANVTAPAGHRARFEVQIEGSGQPLYYQWQKDGVDLVNAIRSIYVTPVLESGDSGKKYRCRVSAAGVDTLSAEATLTVSGSEPSTQQPYIGINFVGGGNSLPGPLLPEDVAGAVLQENWNNLEGLSFDVVPLTDASGVATPVTFSGIFTETWYSGAITTGGADGVLLQGMVTAGSPVEPVTMTLANVPPGNYEVLVYSLGFNFSPAYEQDYALTAGSTHTSITGRAEVGLAWAADPRFRRITSTNPDARETGNYVQFNDVSPAPDGSLTLAVTWAGTGGNTHQPAINAIQLVKVVEVTVPPTLAAPTIQGGDLVLSWTGGKAPFAVERRDTLSGSTTVVTTTSERTASVPMTGNLGFFQVRGSD